MTKQPSFLATLLVAFIVPSGIMAQSTYTLQPDIHSYTHVPSYCLPAGPCIAITSVTWQAAFFEPQNDAHPDYYQIAVSGHLFGSNLPKGSWELSLLGLGFFYEYLGVMRQSIAGEGLFVSEGLEFSSVGDWYTQYVVDRGERPVAADLASLEVWDLETGRYSSCANTAYPDPTGRPACVAVPEPPVSLILLTGLLGLGLVARGRTEARLFPEGRREAL